MHTKQIIKKSLNDWGVTINEATSNRQTVSKELCFEDFEDIERTLLGLSNTVKSIGLLLQSEMKINSFEVGLSLEIIGTLQNELSNNGFSEAIQKLYKE